MPDSQKKLKWSLLRYQIHTIQNWIFRNLDTHKGFYDYNYKNDSPGLDSGLSSAYSGADPVNAYNKGRIGKISKNVFDNEDFQMANNTVTPEELKNPPRGKDWAHIWRAATADPRD